MQNIGLWGGSNARSEVELHELTLRSVCRVNYCKQFTVIDETAVLIISFGMRFADWQMRPSQWMPAVAIKMEILFSLQPHPKSAIITQKLKKMHFQIVAAWTILHQLLTEGNCSLKLKKKETNSFRGIQSFKSNWYIHRIEWDVSASFISL